MRVRKKPVVVDAVKFDGNEESVAAIRALVKNSAVAKSIELTGDQLLLIPTLEGLMRANVGDWIIRGVQGEIYPVKDPIFQATYEVWKDDAYPDE